MPSPLSYLGGKSRLAKEIVKRISKHQCYVEPFVGAGWVFFRKPPSSVEVLNDADGELINFWRTLQQHYEAFVQAFNFAVISRAEFLRKKKVDPQNLTELQRAVRYFYLQRICFGGRVENRTYGYSISRAPAILSARTRDMLPEYHQRFAQVQFEHGDFAVCLKRYDSPHTFFYLDPPYWETVGYEVPFGPEDFLRLRDALRGLQGKFLLSLNDHPDIRRMFGEFHLEAVGTRYTLANGRKAKDSRLKRRGELFITNYKP